MVKYSYCGYEGGASNFKLLRKPWILKFYTVKILECPKCYGVFNYYYGVSLRGKVSQFTIRAKPGRR